MGHTILCDPLMSGYGALRIRGARQKDLRFL